MTGDLAKTNPFRFSTKYQDAESDLLYYGYRYYNASTGRWLSRDPIGELGGLNIYGMTGNNPVNIVDPHGLLAPAPTLTGASLGGSAAAAGGISVGLVVAAVAAGLIADVALVGIDLHLANEIEQLEGEGALGEQRIDEMERNLQRQRPSKSDPLRAGFYSCLARCNVHPTPYTIIDPDTERPKPCKAPSEKDCPKGTQGVGTAKTEQMARLRALDNAQEAIRGRLGCRTRHCHVIRCWKN